MKKNLKNLIVIVLLTAVLAFALGLFAGRQGSGDTPPAEPTVTPVQVAEDEKIDEHGSYTSMEEVALYIYTYGKLPENFVTKDKAKELGWVSSKQNLQKVCDGCSIGRDRFGNREGILPKKSGRKYYECDIDFDGRDRNAKRIVYSNDGLIYYTDDHYQSFTLLYGEP